MASLKKLFFILIFSTGLLLLNACSDSSTSSGNTQCDGSLSCPNYNTNINTCCNNNSCWYEANSQTFNCNGTDCYTAAQNVTNYCHAADVDGLASSLSIEKARNVKLNIDLDAAYKTILE